MWHEGKIVEWNDDRGFGFVQSPRLSDRVFFHIKDFERRGRRPAVGDSVMLSVGQDDKGRERAVTISYVEEPPQYEDAGGSGAIVVAALVGGTFIGLLAANVYFGQLPCWAPAAYVFMSPASMFLYSADKNAARRGKWRISERTLLLVDLLGGWIGALFAQIVLRHKIRKPSFLVPFWAIVGGHFLLCLLASRGLFAGVLNDLAP